MGGSITIHVPTISRENALAALKPKGRRKSHPEDAFQIALVNDLRRILHPRVVMAAVPNGGYRTRAEAGILKAMGVLPGFPDLLFLWNGRAYGLELKAPKGKLSPAQKELHPRLAVAGMTVGVVRSLDEALDSLRAAGVPLRIKN